MDEPLRAALMITNGSGCWRRLAELNAYAERRGWRPVAWVRTWTDLVAATNRCRWCGMGGGADIGLITSYDCLAPDRTPRLVAVYEEPPTEPDPTRPVIRW